MRPLLSVLMALLVLAPASFAAVPSWAPEPIGDPCPGQEGTPFEVAALDGTILRGHVHFPQASRPVSIVLEMSPYFGLVAGITMCPPSGPYVDPLFDAGLAIALVSLRGTGASEGCVQFGGPTDVSDVGVVIEALAGKPYSDRNVAMVGGSFSGLGAMMGVASRAPHLRAVIAVSPVVDWWSTLTRGGATWMPSDPAPMPAPLVIGAFAPGVGLNAFGVAGFWGPTLPPIVNVPPASHVACPSYVEHEREAAQLFLGDRTPYWQVRDHRPYLEGATTPILLVNGLRNFEETISQVDGLWDILDGDKRFILGNWNHLGTPAGFDAEQANWLLHYLQGAPLSGGVNVTRYQDGQNGWHAASSWPPPGTAATLALSGASLVHAGAPVASATQTFQSFDANPCLGLCIAPPVNFQPVCGPFQALYVSEPLASDVVLAGNFRARFTLSSSMPDGNLAAFVFASATGTCPDPAEREVRRAMGTLRHVFTDQGADFPVDSATSVEMTSLPFVAPVRAGERLVLAIGGGAAPITPRHMHPMLSVTTGEGLAGELELTVVEGTLAFSS